MNLSTIQKAEVVGAEETTKKQNTWSSGDWSNVFKSIGEGVGSMIGQSKYGKQEPGTTIVQQGMPNWVLPAAAVGGGLLLITLLGTRRKRK